MLHLSDPRSDLTEGDMYNKFRSVTVLLAALLAACSSKEEGAAEGAGEEHGDARDGAIGQDADDGEDGAEDDDDAGLDAGGGASDADASGGFGGGSDGGGASGEGGGPQVEICDGKDNDRDGIIDNVDAEKDGVCDCLNIATIGAIGPWSNGGNVFKTWLSMRSPTGAVELANQVLTDELLSKFQVIVVLHVGNVKIDGNGRSVDAHHEFTADETAALARWVRAGGGLMSTIGYGDENSEVVNANRLLSPLGMGYSTTKKETDGFVEQWEMHPISENVKKIRTANGVEPEGPMGMTLARDGASRVALQVTQAQDGRVAVWGDEWITYDSEWDDKADQQVDRLWLNLLKWLSPPKVCQVMLPPVVLE
jgi:hypothetical protein